MFLLGHQMEKKEFFSLPRLAPAEKGTISKPESVAFVSNSHILDSGRYKSPDGTVPQMVSNYSIEDAKLGTSNSPCYKKSPAKSSMRITKKLNRPLKKEVKINFRGKYTRFLFLTKWSIIDLHNPKIHIMLTSLFIEKHEGEY